MSPSNGGLSLFLRNFPLQKIPCIRPVRGLVQNALLVLPGIDLRGGILGQFSKTAPVRAGGRSNDIVYANAIPRSE